jgi:drug/metabolite transporter (DMT)-like permease
MTTHYLAFAGLGIVWGTNFLFMKMAVSVLDPLQVVWLRVLFGSLPILTYALLRKSLKWSDLKNTHHFITMSLLANVLPYFFFVKGTQHLNSGVAGVISGTIPLMTVLFSILFLPSERVNQRKILGLILGFLGVTLIAYRQNTASAAFSGEAKGAVFMLLGSVGYATAMVYARMFITPLKMGALQLAAYQTFFGSLILTVTTSTQGIAVLWDHPDIILALVLGLGFLGTGCAFVMYYSIIEHLGAVTASSVFYIPPLVALLVGGIFMKETISLIQTFGTFLLLGGIYFARERHNLAFRFPRFRRGGMKE